VAVADAGGLDQRVELRLIEEPDVLVGVLGVRLLGKLAWVLMGPALADREIEDAVQEPQIVQRALDRVLFEAHLDEVLDVIDSDVRDRRLPEVRDQMHGQVALIVLQRRILAVLRSQLLDQSRPDLFDAHALGDGRRRLHGRGHLLA
jgi:hypothetical protein